MSLPVSSSYYFEPLWQLNMSCEERRDNTRIVGRLDKVLGGILDCQEKQINNLARSDITVHICTVQYFLNISKRFSVRKNSRSCQFTRLSVVKTIRLHLNGILPWIDKHPSLKVTEKSSRDQLL